MLFLHRRTEYRLSKYLIIVEFKSELSFDEPPAG